ncbi:MAG: sugar ABC transporter ATP-binding protein [Sphaerochaetaceae bacterium]|nr:sugar ABC transporter ATP-binding protein [Sphaerochaetaceae bacterium]
MNDNTVLNIKSISKEFSKVKVLNNVSLSLKKGECLGLIGENGAGKSTLIKIINGIYYPSGGSLELEGKPVDIKDSHTAKSLGISMVPQEFNLIPTLNVFENIFLGNEIKLSNGLLDKIEMRKIANNLLDQLKTNISVEEKISQLSVAEKQMVEVSKALINDSKIIIFDEPTTTLTSHEIEVLFELIRGLKEAGVSLVFVSHKLHEVKEICERVAILRDGNLICVKNVEDIDEQYMAQQMVGREITKIFPQKRDSLVGDRSVLRVEKMNLTRKVIDASIHLKKGEILGLAGLVGAGRTELAECIMGLRHKKSGEIFINEKKVDIPNPRVAINNSLAYISEDRQGRGIHLIFDIPTNTTMISLKKYVKNCLLDKDLIHKKSSEYIDVFNTKAASLKNALKFLSGGNQQKVYLAKCMDTNPEILILDEPTRGIDINAKSEIYQFISELQEKGMSIIVISSELEEIIGLCNRVYVLREGKICGELTGEDINEEEIMYYATGVKVM